MTLINRILISFCDSPDKAPVRTIDLKSPFPIEMEKFEAAIAKAIADELEKELEKAN